MSSKHYGLTPDKWIEVRAAYEQGASILSLSKKYEVNRRTIAHRRDVEGWVVGVHVPGTQMNGQDEQFVQRQTQARVIDIATRKALERAVENGTLENTVAAIARDLEMQGSIAVKVLQAVDKTLDKFIAGEIEPSDKQNLGDVLSSIVSATKAGFALSREMHGKRPGDPSIVADVDSKVDAIEFFVPNIEELESA